MPHIKPSYSFPYCKRGFTVFKNSETSFFLVEITNKSHNRAIFRLIFCKRGRKGANCLYMVISARARPSF